MDCISCQDLANDSGQTAKEEEEEEEEDGIAFPELQPASSWTQLNKIYQALRF